ncbi:MAG: efflux RND transporter periplasmic adaptor subunit [Hyphomonadaceae bacterium]|nr:efflux RND transporter periplasmic adaptor subunit [Hyphomonadaceae bacterium]
MNKPDLPLLERPEGLFKRAKDASGKALRTARDAGKRAWDRATDAPDENKRRRKILFLLGGSIAAVIAVLFIVSRIGGDNNIVAPDTPPGQAVSVVEVAPRTFETEVSLNGEARPVRDIQVTAQATGVRILQILVDEGDMVRQGQAMARLDTALSNAQTSAARASVAEAESAAVRARGEYERAESIRDSGALSAEAIEQRRAAALAADARLAASRAQLAETNTRLGGGYVRAPASGLVIDRSAELGSSTAGQVLFRIAADNRLEVSAQVAEGDALALQEGQAATFSLVDGSTVEGRLRRLPASINSQTRTGEALFSLPAGTRVRSGMYLRGHANLPPRETIAVPQSSILYDAGQAYVYVVSQQATPITAEEREARRDRPADSAANTPTYAVSRQPVQVGGRDGDFVEIVSGLQIGQRIVGSGAAFLQSGESVRVLQTPAPATEQPAAQQQAPAEGIRGREH